VQRNGEAVSSPGSPIFDNQTSTHTTPFNFSKMLPFTIISIPTDAREDTEQLGSKPKFWVLLDGQRWLFKEARPQTGEDWAEKVAAEIAHQLGINAATVELAEFSGKVGCISRNFIDVSDGEALVHGNEVMAWQVTGYDKDKIFRQSDHTLENIQRAIRGLADPAHTDAMLTELASYMVLDALIGNTDRHHENWGLRLHGPVSMQSRSLSVAPSFDHASSLGRELRDARRMELLEANRIAWYVGKGRGGIFRDPQQQHGENPLRLVLLAAKAYPSFFRPALERIAAFDTRMLHEILASLPMERATVPARQFAEAMVLNARTSLIELLK
jgi:hypothetical protein